MCFFLISRLPLSMILSFHSSVPSEQPRVRNYYQVYFIICQGPVWVYGLLHLAAEWQSCNYFPREREPTGLWSTFSTSDKVWIDLPGRSLGPLNRPNRAKWGPRPQSGLSSACKEAALSGSPLKAHSRASRQRPQERDHFGGRWCNLIWDL